MRHITQTIAGLTLTAVLVAIPTLPATMVARAASPAGASAAHHGAARTVRVVRTRPAPMSHTVATAQDDACFAVPTNPPGASAPQGGDTAKTEGTTVTVTSLPDATFVASVEGVTPDVLQQDLAAGQTLLQIAGNKYASAGDLATALLVNLKTKLGYAVTAGKLTSAQADAIYAQSHDAYTQLVVTPHPTFTSERRPEGDKGDAGANDTPASRRTAVGSDPSLPGATAVACVAGVTSDVLRQDLAAGQTVLQIAGSKYASADDLATALLVGVRTKLNYGVSGGQWTNDQANAIYARMHHQYVQLVVTPHPPLWPE